MKRIVFALVILGFFLPSFSVGQSLDIGPEDYPIAWTFQRYGLPVQIFQEFQDWRRIRDHEGAMGWMHKSQLGTARTILTQEEIVDVRVEPNAEAELVARVEPGVVMTLIACEVDWCHAKAKGYRGWVQKTGLWGVLPEDIFDE